MTEITQVITTAPVPEPNRATDTPSEFSDHVDAQLSWDRVYVDEVNTWAVQANVVATAINNDAASASTSASESASSADSSQFYADLSSASASMVGNWTDLVGSIGMPSTVYHSNQYWALRVALADVTLSEPSSSNTDWANASAIPDGAIGDIQDPILNLPLNNSLSLINGVGTVTGVRAGNATYIDRYGVVQSLAAGEIGFNENGADLPPASTNLVLYSQDLSNPVWLKNRTTITTGVTAPDGGVSDKLQQNTDVGGHYIDQLLSVDTSKEYTLSAYLKAGELSKVRLILSSTVLTDKIEASFDLVTGIFLSSNATGEGVLSANSPPTIEALIDDWYKITVTGTTTTSDTGVLYTWIWMDDADHLNTTDGLYIWRPQVENLPFATSPIATEAAPVARLGATIEFDYAENFPGSLKDKTVVFDVNVIGTYVLNPIAFNSGDLKLLIGGDITVSDSLVYAYMSPGSQSNRVTKSGKFRYAVTYSLSDVINLRVYINGVFVAQDTVAITADAPTSTIVLNFLSRAYIQIKNLRIYDKAFDEATMRIL